MKCGGHSNYYTEADIFWCQMDLRVMVQMVQMLPLCLLPFLRPPRSFFYASQFHCFVSNSNGRTAHANFACSSLDGICFVISTCAFFPASIRPNL